MPHFVPQSTNTTQNNATILKQKINLIENSPFSWWLSEGQTKLPPEVERDNVEYKVKIVSWIIVFYLSVEIDRNVRGKKSPFSYTNEMACR